MKKYKECYITYRSRTIEKARTDFSLIKLFQKNLVSKPPFGGTNSIGMLIDSFMLCDI